MSSTHHVKDSGLQGELIPDRWESKRAKYLFREIDERSETGSDELLSVSHITGVTPRREKDITMFMAESYEGYKTCKPGDLVINTMWAWMGAMGISCHAGIVSSSYGVYRLRQPDHYHSQYLDLLLRTPLYIAEYNRRSNGITSSRARLYPQDFLDIPILCPPRQEQNAIVAFLDWKLAKINRYIHTKHRLIELLNEQKQAIIQQAITCGPDPSIRHQSTGDKWFPEIPIGWQVLPLRRVIYRAVDGPHLSPNYLDKGIPFISARNVKVDRWSLDDAKFISQTDYEVFSKRVVPRVGDVLYTKGGTTGIARVVDLPFNFQVWVHIAVLKVQSHIIEPSYLALALNSPRCYEQSQLFTRGATNQDLGLNRMKDIVLPVPSTIQEQRQILKLLGFELNNTVNAIDKAWQDINLIREYRTRLIADVVTGKVDVRGAMCNIPDDLTAHFNEVGKEPIYDSDILDVTDDSLDAEPDGNEVTP
jgi:type I restriction enzyme S subunit